MSGSSEVLQEYLVKLGFKVDQGDVKKFNDAFQVVGKGVLGVGLAVAGVVASVEAAAAAFAYSMRKVYYDSQLAGSSVKNLQSLEYAGKQVGVSAESMGSAIHSMAQAFRTNPGMKGLVESFGIKVEGRDVSDVMTDYVKALDKMPEFQGSQFAGMFGMDPDTYHLLRGHIDELLKKQQEMKDAQAAIGLDMDKAAAQSKHYADSLDNLKMHFEGLTTTILSKTAPAFDKMIGYLNADFDANAKNIAQKGLLANGAENLSHAWTLPFRLEGDALDWFKGAFAGKSSGTPTTPAQRSVHGAITGPAAASAAAPASAASGAHRNERNNNPGNIEYGKWAKDHGATGSDGRFAIFPDLATGYGAAQALLGDYGKSGKNTIGSIIGSWAPSHENDTATYAGTVAKNMGVGVNDKLDMTNPAVISQLTRYIAQYEGMSSAGLAQAPVVNNTFNINGTNAQQIADKVAGAQARTYADALRNGQGVVR
jgi:hypothetical protein